MPSQFIQHEKKPFQASAPELSHQTLSSLFITKLGEIVEASPVHEEWMQKLYNQHAATLLSILIETCSSQNDAEEALVHTFKGLVNHPTFQPCNPVNFIELVKFAVATARLNSALKQPIVVKSFQQSSLLHHLIFEEGNMATAVQKLPCYCAKKFNNLL